VRSAKVQAAVAEVHLERQALSREEIGALDHVFDFGAHTSPHPILPTCTDAEARLEIEGSRAEVELLTIRIRLLICSIDKAEQIGLDWWKYDHHLSPGKQALSAENDDLRKQVRALERQLASVTRRRSAPASR